MKKPDIGFVGLSSRPRRASSKSEAEMTYALAEDPSAFGALLQEMKSRSGLTVPVLAYRMGVVPNAIHQYFYRKRGVGGTSTMRWFLRYAEACGCEVTLRFPESARAGRTAVMTYGSTTNKDGS
jgi:hypothetical protein